MNSPAKFALTLAADKMRFGPHATMSEKLDGICGVWNGRVLATRSGRRINAPADFIAELPALPCIGELWCGRGTFQEVQSIVLRSEPEARLWRDVRFMVFEGAEGLRPCGRLGVVAQLPARGVREFAEGIIAKGGEGVVVRDGRSIFKIKLAHDEEATVIGHEPGKGRNAGRLGALIVRDKYGNTFKLGTGLTDATRNKPPRIGSVVTFTFKDRTDSGKPKFATFMRVRRGGA